MLIFTVQSSPLISSRNLPLAFMLVASCSPAMHFKELGLPFPVKLFWALGGCLGVPSAISFSRKKQPSSLSLSPFLLPGLWRAPMELSTCFLYWRTKNQALCSRCSLVSAKLKGIITSLHLLATLLLIQPCTVSFYHYQGTLLTWNPTKFSYSFQQGLNSRLNI